jgi:WD repeat-containing protein 19
LYFAGKTRNEGLIHQLLDYLMGDTDGVPKDSNYIFKLYMALGNYAQAAKTGVMDFVCMPEVH